MPVNHNINVRITDNLSGDIKTSAKGSVKRSFQKTSERGNMTSRKMATAIKGVGAGNVSALGSFGVVAGLGTLVVKQAIQYASKAVDIYVDITQSATGEKIRAGNIKRIKGYLLNPMGFAVDATYGVWLQSLEVNRQNQANDYYRELTGNLIVSKQYGEKR